MNEALLPDLDAFERHEVSRAQMLARHGEEAVAPLAMHDRLRALSTPSAFDVEAGWRRVAAGMETPATVIALRPRARRPRSIVLAAAATLMLASSAFAVMGPRLLEGPAAVVTVVRDIDGVDEVAGGETRGHPIGMGDPAVEQGSGDVAHAGADGSQQPGTGGTGTDGASTDGSSEQPEDPADRDQGTGNDGGHDDHGGGNDGHEGDASDGGSNQPKDQSEDR